MARHWIEDEFTRTGLPKSALAEYLGLDNAAVSRMMSLERQMTPDEIGLARAFFSIVSDKVSESTRDAIRRLRSTKVRDAAAVTLAELLLAHVSHSQLAPEQDALDALLRKVATRTATLTSDQIVALCRILKVDVGGLIVGKASFGSRMSDAVLQTNILAELQTQARRWANGREPIYEFRRKAEPAAPRITTKTNVISLQPADAATDDLATCESYLIPDDSYAPRFEQGQTIFLDRSSEPRRGDYVAAVLKDSRSKDVKAMLGKLLYVSRDMIGISSPKNIRAELPRNEVAGLRRIAYCKM